MLIASRVLADDEMERLWFTPLKEIRSNDKYYLIQFKGRMLIVAFWAMWNQPSRSVLLDLERVKTAVKRKDIRIDILSINIDSDIKQVLRLIDGLRLTFPTFLISREDFRLLGKGTIPFVILFNKDGDIIWSSTGYKENLLKYLLDQIDIEGG